MSLLVLIPTFQRPDTLLWSLQSVLKQKFGQTDFAKKLFILNNDLSTKAAVDFVVKTAVEQAGAHEFDEIKIVQGNTAVYVAENIYNHLKTFTAEGDIAIIHGDDDIMLPNTLAYRYRSAYDSPQSVCISQTIWSCSFIKNKKGIFLNNITNPYQRGIPYTFTKASKEDIAALPLPFISVYAYKIGPDFRSVYDQAISWSDELPFEPQIRYPFVPFFIGLAAYYQNQLSVSPEPVVIRGQLFAFRKFLPPFTVTEYANAGIVQLTGLAVLNNKQLRNHVDYDAVRNNFRDNTKNYILQSFFRRNGVSIAKLKLLYQISHARYRITELSVKNILQNIRNLSDNIIFTRNIKRWITGWGNETSPAEFWENWDKSNQPETLFQKV